MTVAVHRRWWAPLLTLLTCLAVVSFDVLASYQASLTLALLIFTLSALVFSWLPSTLAATLFMLGAVVASLAPPEVIFSGFHSSALWLVFGSMLISHALVRTGIDKRIARTFDYLPHRTYGGALLSVMAVGMALLLIIPSAFSRVVLIIPIAAAFSQRLGFQRGDVGFNGIVTMAVCSTYLTSFSVLTTGYPDLIVAGITENLFGLDLNYGKWLIYNFPIFGVLRLGLVFLAIYWMFPARLDHGPGVKNTEISP
ncbi:MAG: SLC13 family permease, partial [Natronospirillum sp.]